MSTRLGGRLKSGELRALRAVYMRAHDLVEALRGRPDEYPEILDSMQGDAWAKLDDALKGLHSVLDDMK